MSSVPPLGPQAVEDEVDLDYGDDEPDPNADAKLLEVPRYERTPYPPHAHDDWTDWRPIFAALREYREAKHRKVEAGGGILAHSSETLPLPRNTAALVKRLELARFDVRTQATAVVIAPLLYVGSSDDHDAGDVRTGQHPQYRWCVQALLAQGEQRIAWLWATWERRETPGSKPGNKFLNALTWDVVSGRGYEPTATGFEDWVGVFAAKA